MELRPFVSPFATLALLEPPVYFAADDKELTAWECEKRSGACVPTSCSADQRAWFSLFGSLC